MEPDLQQAFYETPEYLSISLEERIKYWYAKASLYDRMQTQVAEGFGNIGLYILNTNLVEQIGTIEKDFEAFIKHLSIRFGISPEVGLALCKHRMNSEAWLAIARGANLYNKKVGQV